MELSQAVPHPEQREHSFALRVFPLRRLRSSAVYLFYFVFVGMILGEIGTRLMTTTGENGMPAILQRVPLMPYRPEQNTIEAWIGRRYHEQQYIIRDSLLGWTINPNGSYKNLYEANSQGIRADRSRVYNVDPPSGKIRILTVGDSFTHCDEVTNVETWQHYLEELRPEWEVINMGVPAYGTDQAFLRWSRDGVRFRSHVVVLGIWPENICRNLSVIRYFLYPTSEFAAKPRFLLNGDSLVLVNSPILSQQRLVKAIISPEQEPVVQYEFWHLPHESDLPVYYHSRLARSVVSLFQAYKRYTMRSELYSGENPIGINLQTAIVASFARSVRARGALPVIVIFPMRSLLDVYSSQDSLPLTRCLREQGFNVIDLGSELVQREEGKLDQLAPRHKHITVEGNRVQAQVLEQQLQKIIGGKILAGTEEHR